MEATLHHRVYDLALFQVIEWHAAQHTVEEISLF